MEKNKRPHGFEFFEELEEKVGGRSEFLKECSKLRAFLDWNARCFDDSWRYSVIDDPAVLLFLSNGYDKIALHFDAKTKTFKSYNASAADLMGWIASEKEVNPEDFEDWDIEDLAHAATYMQHFLKELEEDGD